MPDDQIAAVAAADAADGVERRGIEIWPENWPAVRLFVALETQWRVGIGMGVAIHLGLEYGAIEPTMRLMRIDDRDGRLFEDLQTMERAALEILNGG